MSIVLNGSTGIQNVLGSASAPADTNTTTPTTGVYYPSATTWGVSTAGTNALYIDASQNVGIGTTSPVAVSNYHTLNINGSSGGILYIQNNGTTVSQFSGDSGATNVATLNATPLIFQTNATERMRIDNSGNVGIGTTSTSVFKLSVNGTANFSSQLAAVGSPSVSTQGAWIGWNFSGGAGETNIINQNGGGGGGITFSQSTTANVRTEWGRFDSSGNLLVGTTSTPVAGSSSLIASKGYAARSGVSGSFSGNAFNINWTGSPQLWIDSTNVGTISVVSDYRLKQNINTQEKSALDRILQIRPVTYEFKNYGEIFKADGVTREGFIAHELQAIIPSAVDGEKDAEDQIQSLRLDALCSVLVKAIQELKAEFDAYKAAHP